MVYTSPTCCSPIRLILGIDFLADGIRHFVLMRIAPPFA
jgi:cytochrome c oxidase assembly factor CtaG